MIPKSIFSIWLSTDGSMPDVVKKCIESQKIPGYEHKLITLDNIDPEFFSSKYIQEALQSPHRDGIKYCKMSDYLRMRYLHKYGGIYLDADVEVLPGKNFDDLLGNGMFAARENNGFIATATVASIPKHPFVGLWIETVENNFRGDDDKNFESSMEILTNGYWQWPEFTHDFRLYNTHYFFPYDHQRGTIEVTPDTRSFHHFMKTWISTSPDILPTISIVIPHLGREEGLKRCLKSIDQLYYPKHLIETIVLDGPETVPQKVDIGLKQSRGDIICYASNDMEFNHDSMYLAVQECQRMRGLVSFGGSQLLPDNGNICEHFVIHRDLIQQIGGQIFDTDFHHVGVDNLLWAKASKLGKAMHLASAIVTHYHFTHGAEYDDVYRKGWSHLEEDRELLKKKLQQL